jgi:hypothetical protein
MKRESSTYSAEVHKALSVGRVTPGIRNAIVFGHDLLKKVSLDESSEHELMQGCLKSLARCTRITVAYSFYKLGNIIEGVMRDKICVRVEIKGYILEEKSPVCKSEILFDSDSGNLLTE